MNNWGAGWFRGAGMEALQESRMLAREGKFLVALAALDRGPLTRQDRASGQVLRAELLERLGRYSQARTIAETLLKSKDLAASDRSTCHFVVGMTELNHGNYGDAIV